MPLSKRKRQDLLTLCGQLNEDDAIDQREFFKKKYRSKDSKALRLCKQVSDTLALLLSGELGDEVLQSLEVFSVQPAPNTRRLLVVVRPAPDLSDSITPDHILERIAVVRGFLIAEVAQAISRRRAPNLIFEVIWPSD